MPNRLPHTAPKAPALPGRGGRGSGSETAPGRRLPAVRKRTPPTPAGGCGAWGPRSSKVEYRPLGESLWNGAAASCGMVLLQPCPCRTDSYARAAGLIRYLRYSRHKWSRWK
jgi:hypothetical protein